MTLFCNSCTSGTVTQKGELFMSNATMRAIRAHDYGGPEQLALVQAPVPEPGAGQVRVRLLVAGVNPADWKFRQGLMKQFAPLTFPWTPGLEGAGLVDAVGEGVDHWRPGQAVFGPMSATYAEYTLAPAGDLVAKPAGLSFEEAASVPVGALTAWGAVERAGLQPGQRVLVQGAAGGVGLFAVQFARLKGAHVIGTASAANVEFVRSLGAETVIDYTAGPFEQAVQGVDAVVDTVGGEVTERSWKVLRPDGILVTVAGMIDEEQAQAHGVHGARAGRAGADQLAHITELLESKQIKPCVGRVFPLDQAAQAHELSQRGHGRGRIVLHIADIVPA
jgi:NADPH:quinone reductase-like Zn-dependent oxidoreductase